MATTDTEHTEILELLPWYANGTLSNEESRRVREHLERHPELAAEAQQTEALMDTLGDDVAVPMLTHDRIRGVMERLDDAPAKPRNDVMQRLRDWWQSAPALGLPLATAAAVALLAFVLIPEPTSDNGDYRTLSSERPPVSVQVELAPGVDAAGAEALFDSLSLDARRQAGSMYIVTLPGDMPVADLFETLQTLRADDRVVDANAQTDED